MPSARFLKLKGPKKIKILEAAMKEFLMHPVTMVSINQIIKSAGLCSKNCRSSDYCDKGKWWKFISFCKYVICRRAGERKDEHLCSALS